jgi:hypothetical protein
MAPNWTEVSDFRHSADGADLRSEDVKVTKSQIHEGELLDEHVRIWHLSAIFPRNASQGPPRFLQHWDIRSRLSQAADIKMHRRLGILSCKVMPALWREFPSSSSTPARPGTYGLPHTFRSTVKS